MAERTQSAVRAVVIGAGIGGLSAAAYLLSAGMKVTVLERHDHPGGKIRSVASDAGPVDAGPTVLTLKPVFEHIFNALGTSLGEHIALKRLPLIARHFWPDGGVLDLTDSHESNLQAIGDFSGPAEARAFEAFHRRTRALFDAFEAPMMLNAEPSVLKLGAVVARSPSLLRAMAPMRTLAATLARQFADPRLAQLFGRYATYVGGSPYQAPALLSLIWQAEANGVWQIDGGMHKLPDTLADLCRRNGAEFAFASQVRSIELDGQSAKSVILEDGRRLPADVVVFNGDPRALAVGALGPSVQSVAKETLKAPRSLSAAVWSFAARPSGPPLAHHNVFFAADPRSEFDDLKAGRLPRDPTLYICAQDRGGLYPVTQGRNERFEIIANAPPMETGTKPDTEFSKCQTRTFQTLRRFGLEFDPMPARGALTMPQDFAAMFPESAGSLYGQSPHGQTAALKRPRARTAIRGLYLAGGGTHPGAGIPMAALSGRHAAEAIMTDHASPFRSLRTATPGGTSTGSATTRRGPFRS